MFSDGFIQFENYEVRFALIALLAYIVLMGMWCKKTGHKYKKDDNISKFKTQKYQLVWGTLIAVFFLLLFFGRGELEKLRELFLNYSRAEAIVQILIFAASMSVYIYQGNSAQYANLMVKIVRIECLAFMYCNYLSGICPVTNVWNIASMLFISAYLFLGTNLRFVECTSKSRSCNRSAFEAKERYCDLSKNFRKTADRIINIIKMDMSATYSICLSGDWGIGKTSIVRGAMDKLKQFDDEIYEVIYINALELDTPESLFRYLFSRIKHILKKNGVYVGIGSTYRKFVGSAVDTITKSSLSILLEGELFAEIEDYRDQKNALSSLIGKTIGNGRIIVVVDDVERCHKDRVKDYLFFVKEIAGMERCIPIFVTDHNRLAEQIRENNEDSHVFLDKFFNYSVHIVENAADEIVQLMQGEIQSLCRIPFLKSVDIQATIKAVHLRLENKTSSNEHSREYLMAKEKLDRDMKNSRTLIKLFEKLKVYYLALDVRYSKGILNKRTTNNVNQEVREYGEKIDLHGILFFLAYTECCAPMEFKKIVYAGEKYLKEATPDSIVDETSALVVTLVDCIFNKSSTSFYNRKKAFHFLYLILNGEDQLADAVNNYESEFERNLDYMRRGLFEDISKSFGSISNAMIKKLSEDKKSITDLDVQALTKFLAYQLDRNGNDMASIIAVLDSIMKYDVSVCCAHLMSYLYRWTKDRLIPISNNKKALGTIRKFSERFVNFETNELINYAREVCLLNEVPENGVLEILNVLLSRYSIIYRSDKLMTEFLLEISQQLAQRLIGMYPWEATVAEKSGTVKINKLEGWKPLSDNQKEELDNKMRELCDEYEYWLKIKKELLGS